MSAVRILGLLSGTSVDGVDAAAASVELAGDTLRITRLGELTLLWPGELRSRVLAARSDAPVGAGELCRLDQDLGTALGDIAVAAIARLGTTVDLIASHGQTVHHAVDEDGRVRGPLQLGQPAELAERTGMPVVAGFRARDVAAGGEGAPLVSVLDALLLAEAAEREPVAALNLGGIANLTVLRPGRPVLAFDCGPGNTLLDVAMARAGERYDAGGRRTARGTVDGSLLAVLLADPFLAAPPPKSTGQERYHAGFLDAALARVARRPAEAGERDPSAEPGPVGSGPVGSDPVGPGPGPGSIGSGRVGSGPAAGGPGATGMSLDDLLATLAESTATTVASAATEYGVRRVWASGGGVHNAGLMAALRRRLAAAGATLATTEELGLPVDAKEAYAFAVLGWLTWHGLPGNLPSCTGAAGPRILGAITPGAGPLRLPEPPRRPPRRAVVLPGSR